MSGSEQQRAILASEFYWFGGQLGSPKVFDTGTNFSAMPTLRTATVPDMERDVDESDREMRLTISGGILAIELDEA